VKKLNHLDSHVSVYLTLAPWL